MGKHRFNPSTRRFADVPREPCVYVAELSTGVVKVGASSCALYRMMSLASEAKRHHGSVIERFQVFTRATYKGAYEAETRAVHRLRAIGTQVPGRREYFVGITFEDAIAAVDAACRNEAESTPEPASVRDVSQPSASGEALLRYMEAIRDCVPPRPRKSPPVDAYLEDLRAGMRLAEIAKKHGKASAAVVHNALTKRGLPTTYRALMARETVAAS